LGCHGRRTFPNTVEAWASWGACFRNVHEPHLISQVHVGPPSFLPVAFQVRELLRLSTITKPGCTNLCQSFLRTPRDRSGVLGVDWGGYAVYAPLQGCLRSICNCCPQPEKPQCRDVKRLECVHVTTKATKLRHGRDPRFLQRNPGLASDMACGILASDDARDQLHGTPIGHVLRPAAPIPHLPRQLTHSLCC
jgi:hypothetical protein